MEEDSSSEKSLQYITIEHRNPTNLDWHKEKIKVFIKNAIKDYHSKYGVQSNIDEILGSPVTQGFMDHIFHLLNTTSADTSILSVDSV